MDLIRFPKKKHWSKFEYGNFGPVIRFIGTEDLAENPWQNTPRLTDIIEEAEVLDQIKWDLLATTMIKQLKLEHYLPEFITALEDQLTRDYERWGDTWRERGLWHNGKSQELRFLEWVEEKYKKSAKGADFPWVKTAAKALIGWVRANKTGWEK